MPGDHLGLFADLLATSNEVGRVERLRSHRDDLIRALYGRGITTPALAVAGNVSESWIKGLVADIDTSVRRQDRRRSAELADALLTVIRRRERGGWFPVTVRDREMRLLLAPGEVYASYDEAAERARQLGCIVMEPCSTCDGTGWGLLEPCTACEGRRLVLAELTG